MKWRQARFEKKEFGEHFDSYMKDWDISEEDLPNYRKMVLYDTPAGEEWEVSENYFILNYEMG